MKRAVFSAALLVFIGLGTAVVGGPEAEDGEMTIIGVGGSAEATQSVGPNGTSYRTTLENTGSSCLTGNQSTGVNFTDFRTEGELTRVDFSGTLETPTPQYRADLNVSEESENSYRVDIVEKSLGGTGVTCIGAVDFNGSFAAKEDFKLEVFHEGEKIFEDSTSGYTPGESQEKEETDSAEGKSGFWKVLSDIFGVFF